MMRDKYIFVYQDVRGRYMSEGTFVIMRPFVADSVKARDPKAIDEASDTYDTIDWLLEHVPDNSGRSGSGVQLPRILSPHGCVVPSSRARRLVAAGPGDRLLLRGFPPQRRADPGVFLRVSGLRHPASGTDDANWWMSKMIADVGRTTTRSSSRWARSRTRPSGTTRTTSSGRRSCTTRTMTMYWQTRAVPDDLTAASNTR